MITYIRNGKKLEVYLGKKHVGTIQPVDGGYAYFPKDSRHRGDTFPTYRAVMESLEAGE